MQGISVVIPFYCGNSYLETMAEQLKKNINNFKSDLKNVEVEVILVMIVHGVLLMKVN